MEILGKEYHRKLVPVKVQVKQYAKSFVHIGKSYTLAKIWDKRRCFICHGKFKDCTNVTVAITDKGNKLICEACSATLPDMGGMTNGKIEWDVRPGTHWARCSCTNPPRKLGQDEIHVTFFHDSGSVRNAGSAKCKKCGATISWDTR